MSSIEQAIRDAFADKSVDFMSVGRTQGGDYFASVKRAGRGYGIHHAPDPIAALALAVASPASAAPDPISRAVADVKAATPSPPQIQDEFG